MPWELDDKATAMNWAQHEGFNTPEFMTSYDRRELTEVALDRWGSVVLKQPNSHSTHGIYLLKRLDSGEVMDFLRLKLVDLDSWPVVGSDPGYWLAEQWIDSGIPGAPIPPDYKLFCFDGQISHVWQVDRQVKPPRIALFDGAFMPLEHGRHFELRTSRLQAGWHRVPIHARSMLDMARRLSAKLGTSFVRVDCFDGPAGPVLGELTFASGPDDARAIVYRSAIELATESGLRKEPLVAVSGFDIDLGRFWTSAPHGADFLGRSDELGPIQAGSLQGDQRYPEAARRRLLRRSGNEVLELSLRVISVINGDNSVAFSLQESLATPTAFVTGPGRRAEFQKIAYTHHSARASNQWHAKRAASLEFAVTGGTQ